MKLDRILVTNDDGIDSPGLATLRDIAAALARDVWVVAPLFDQSGTSHSVTLTEPLRLLPRDERTFGVTGTPGDCVVMAVSHIMGEARPDLVLSGVNRGQNVADDINYSGTLGAAVTAALLGFRAAGLSQAYVDRQACRYQTTAAHAPRLLQGLLATGWNEGVCLNINFPDCEPAEVTSWESTYQGSGTVRALSVEARTDLRERNYFWLRFRRRRGQLEAGSDIAALARNAISVTPLSFDRTDHPARTALADQLRTLKFTGT